MSTQNKPCMVARTANLDLLTTLVHVLLPPQWLALVKGIEEDVMYEGQTYLGLRDAPAAKANHHAYLGGLVEHYLEMWNAYKGMKLTEYCLVPDVLITDQAVLAGIILHDLHKGWCHFVEDAAAPNGVSYGKHPASSLLTQDQKTVYIASKYVDLGVIQLNAVYHSEGGWAASPPKWGTTLSKLLYLLDEISSNVRDRAQGGTVADNFVHVFGDKGVTTKISLPLDL